MKLFKSEKQLKDLVMVYAGYAYIDADLRENNFVAFKKNFVYPNINKNHKDYYYIKKFFDIQKLIFNAILANGIKFNNTQGKILINRTSKELTKAFGGDKKEIIGFYLGVCILFKYKQDVKYKKVFVNVDTNFLIKFINELNEKYYKKDPILSRALDRCEKIADRLFENLYKNEKWYKG